MLKKIISNILVICILTIVIIGVSTTASAHPTLGDIKSYGATGNGTTDDSAAIQSAINAINAAGGGTIFFSVGTYRIASNITFPAICEVEFYNGAKLKPDSGKVVTINGGVKAGLFQIFTGSGTVVGDMQVPYVYPQWWGAKGDDTTDCTAAFQYVVNNFQSIFIPKGTYLITDTITVPYRWNPAGFYITGAGKAITVIDFNPTVAGKVCINVNSSPSSALYKGMMSNFMISGHSGNSLQKIAIRASNTSEVNMEDIQVSNFAGNKSIGLQVRGRELSNYSRMTISADIPISIEANPDAWNCDLDSIRFSDIYLLCSDSAEECVKIAPGLYITNLYFDGRQNWVGGKYGLYWNDSGGSYASANISIKNVRYEQTAAGGGYIIYLNNSYVISNVYLENVYGGDSLVNGFYFNRCANVILMNCSYNGTTGQALHASLVNYLQTIGTFFQQGSTLDIQGMYSVLRGGLYATSASYNCIWQTNNCLDKTVTVVNQVHN